MGRLDEKVAIVTGSGRGIGRATAKLFGAEGAKVVVLSRTPENVERVVADIQADGGEALGVVCDIADPHQITASVKKVIEEYGRIDILVNNAFDPSAVLSSVIDLSTEQLQRNFEMGPIAYLRMMQACYPHLKASGEGRIINFGSTAGVVAIEGYAPYGMAKEAVRALTRSAARVGHRRDHRQQPSPGGGHMGSCRIRRTTADQCARPLRIAREGRRARRTLPLQPRRAVFDRIQLRPRRRLHDRRRTLNLGDEGRLSGLRRLRSPDSWCVPSCRTYCGPRPLTRRPSPRRWACLQAA